MISSQCRHQRNCWNKVAESFQGTKGTVYTDSGDVARMKTYDGSGIYNHMGEDDISPYQIEHNKLFASIRSGGVISDGENGAKATLSAIMGRMATYSGKMITWEEALNSEIQLVPDEADLAFDKMPPVYPDENGNYPIPVPGQFEVLKAAK